jgi:predicted O-methyltransferase YrrM
VNDRQPDNLTLLYDAFSKEAIDSILPGDVFEVDGVEFVCKYSPESTADRFYIVKSDRLVDWYRELCTKFHGGAIFELGIAEGGSTALMALLAEPRKLIAVDLEPSPLTALSEFLDRRGLTDTVRPHYGVDQADRARLVEIARADLAGDALDLVVDDASHMLAETRASFDAVFPFLRPGGLYVIEDWNHDHVMRDAVVAALRNTDAPDYEERRKRFQESLANRPENPEPPARPLYQLAVELMLARASLGDATASVRVDEFWMTVERGTDELDADTFRLLDLVNDHYGFTDPR